MLNFNCFLFSFFATVLLFTSIARPTTSETSEECSCGKDFKAARQRIVGGRKAEGEYPWQVAIYELSRFYCAGTLINDKYILSAGHCFKYFENDRIEEVKKEYITFVLGRKSLRNLSLPENPPDDVIVRYPKEIILHPKFVPEDFYSDISLAKLNEPIDKFDHNVFPICLPTENISYVGVNTTIIGWGALSSGSHYQLDLQEVDVEVFPTDKCEELLKEMFFPDVMMCAALTGRDACQGDSGGPMLYRETATQFTQIGTISSGLGCADPKYPGVFTKLTEFTDWIKENTADAKNCQIKN